MEASPLRGEDDSIGFSRFGKEAERVLIPNIQPLGISNLAVSPDEQTILYVQRDNVSSDLMLVEGLR